MLGIIMWWTLISPVFTAIFGEAGVISQYIQTKAKISQTALDNKLQLGIATLEYNKQLGINAVESEKNKLAATPAWFKFISYIILNYPIILAYFSASKAEALFKNISIIPAWYAMLYVSVVGVIWGLPATANWMGSVFQNLQESWANRQDKKIEKIKVINEAILADNLRKTVFKQGMTQEQWDAITSSVKLASQDDKNG